MEGIWRSHSTTSGHPASSKFNAELEFLQHLKALGRASAQRWLDSSALDDVGVRSSIDVRATVDGTAPIQSLNRLGGFLQLSGFDEGRLTGQQAGLARLVYMRRINDIQQFKAYAGASLESGNVWQKKGDIGFSGNVLAGSLFAGVDTPIGPLYLAWGHNDTGTSAVYLYLGPLFSFK